MRSEEYRVWCEAHRVRLELLQTAADAVSNGEFNSQKLREQGEESKRHEDTRNFEVVRSRHFGGRHRSYQIKGKL